MSVEGFAKRLLHRDWQALHPTEQRVLRHFAERHHVSTDVNRKFDQELTFGQRLADRIATFGGSWPFIGIFAALLLGWVVLNSVILARVGHPFDPYPYILLNLFLSMLAAIQAPVIMMSQNRQNTKDRLDAAHDFEVNLKAELEILALHEKIDGLRGEQWTTLLELQQRQIDMLARLAARGEP